jgi:hypothetical protein
MKLERISGIKPPQTTARHMKAQMTSFKADTSAPYLHVPLVGWVVTLPYHHSNLQ